MLQENHKKLQLRDFCGWNFYDPARKKKHETTPLFHWFDYSFLTQIIFVAKIGLWPKQCRKAE